MFKVVNKLISTMQLNKMDKLFKLEQKTFQSKFRYYKRKYKQEKITNIEHFRTVDLKQFWNIIRNLRPKRSTKHLIHIKAKSASEDIIFLRCLMYRNKTFVHYLLVNVRIRLIFYCLINVFSIFVSEK